jgi:ATP-dependent exoDNAse (exonuclease V) beta subunit
MKAPVPEWVLEELRLHLAGAALLQTLLDQPADEQTIAAEAAALCFESPGLKTLIDGLALSPEEIKAKWQANGAEAANRGTWMHYSFELHLNRELLMDESREFQLFREFLSTLTGYTAYRTEWWIFADKERLAGSIDFAATDARGELLLIDWKRAKNISQKYSNKFRRMKQPLNHLDDISGWHYRLQLNCYKFIIEKYYGMAVSKMLVVCTHPDNGPTAFVDHVPCLEKETALLMDWQRNRALLSATK